MNHFYELKIEWTGNLGTGTSDYRSYSRDHNLIFKDKQIIPGSSDPAFRGDPSKYNPEELFLSSIASCHMLWYLHFCADHGIIVSKYMDTPKGIMPVDKTGLGKFSEASLYPEVWISNSDQIELAIELHYMAHQFCFISNSCNFPIRHFPSIHITKELDNL